MLTSDETPSRITADWLARCSDRRESARESMATPARTKLNAVAHAIWPGGPGFPSSRASATSASSMPRSIPVVNWSSVTSPPAITAEPIASDARSGPAGRGDANRWTAKPLRTNARAVFNFIEMRPGTNPFRMRTSRIQPTTTTSAIAMTAKAMRRERRSARAVRRVPGFSMNEGTPLSRGAPVLSNRAQRAVHGEKRAQAMSNTALMNAL
jgi:hypothetical protein